MTSVKAAMDLRARTTLVGIALMLTTGLSAQQTPSNPQNLLGTWRGISKCSDRVAAPACNDEEVVYEFKAGDKSGVIRWMADKIVAGKRESMGELEMSYDAVEACWKAQFSSPRTTSVWRVVVNGDHLTGTDQLLPGKETIRQIDARRVR